MTFDLFANSGAAEPEFLTPHTVLFPGYLLGEVDWLYAELAALEKQFPFRSMRTPKGKMSVATTSWGPLGWTSDESGYRYTTVDPISQRHWPALPPRLHALASKVADLAGYPNFNPDSCLVNQYSPQSKMGLHQDKNEQDYSQPIVSFSLGLAATFLMGGLQRSDPVHKLNLRHGDVLVFGGPDRLRYHGISSVARPSDNQSISARLNFTFRRVS